MKTPEKIASEIVKTTSHFYLGLRITEAITEERQRAHELVKALESEDKVEFDKWASYHSAAYPSRESFFYGAHQTYCRFRDKARAALAKYRGTAG